MGGADPSAGTPHTTALDGDERVVAREPVLHVRAWLAPLLQRGSQSTTLAVGQRADLLVLRQTQREQDAAAACAAPTPLAHQKIAQRHALGLPRALENDVGDRSRLCRDTTLELGPRKTHAVGLLKGAQVLWRSNRRGEFAHDPPRNGLGFARPDNPPSIEAARPLQIEGGKARRHAYEEALDVAIVARYY